MADLSQVIKLTSAQYSTLASGGTVGSYTGLQSTNVYLVEDSNEYIYNGYISGVQFNGLLTMTNEPILLQVDEHSTYTGDDWDTYLYADKIVINNCTDEDSTTELRFPHAASAIWTLATQEWTSSNFQTKGNYAPSAHASTSNIYGLGTTTLYGHNMLVSGNLSNYTYVDGKAAAASHNHDGRYYSTAAAVSSALGLGAAAFKGVANSITSTGTDLATASAVYTAIDNLPEPMVFKGTLGTGGTITSLPAAAAGNEGYTYKVITAGTYASQAAKVGDVFVSNGSAWVLIPAGDTDSDTWRNIKVNGTELLGTAISTGAVNFKNGNNITITGNGNDITISGTGDTHYTSTFTVKGSGTAVATFNQSANAAVDIVAGNNITVTPDSTNGKITISGVGDTHYTSTFTIYGSTTAVATFNQSANMTLSIVGGTNVTITPDATNHKITISAPDTHYSSTFTVYGGTTSVATFNQSANMTLSFAAGSNVTLTPDASNHKITISATDTTYTAEKGITLSNGKFGHTNTAITAQTTQAVYPIKIDAYGHITSYGTAVTIPNPADYYWANVKVAAASATNTAPTFATASLTSLYFMSGTTSKAYATYNATEDCIDFIFN